MCLQTAKILALSWLVLSLTPAPAQAGEILGRARVIDGDTLDIKGQRIRLEGIDAPELHQTCSDKGRVWACGFVSAKHLRRMVKGKTVACIAHAQDRYGRWLATCTVDGIDISQAMVANGLALAYRKYSDQYVDEEESAKKAGIGIWNSEFERPEDWRHAEKQAR
jgi:endonuclease YncB( thermonuclease family)